MAEVTAGGQELQLVGDLYTLQRRLCNLTTKDYTLERIRRVHFHPTKVWV